MVKRRYQAFVSSTFEDLKEERKEVTQAILENDCFPAGMELFPASNKKQWDIIKKVIDESDFYIVLIAGRYGSLGKDDDGNKVGYTEMEFDYAVKTNKPIIAMLYSDIDKLPKSKSETTQVQNKRLKDFREKAKTGRMVRFWSDKGDLRASVGNAISKLVHDEETKMVGWVSGDYLPATDILWVDNSPEDCSFERKILEDYGIEFKLALNTKQAIYEVGARSYSLIISNMRRPEGEKAGIDLLTSIRRKGILTPYIIYTREPDYASTALDKGGQGLVCEPSELFDLVKDNLIKGFNSRQTSTSLSFRNINIPRNMTSTGRILIGTDYQEIGTFTYSNKRREAILLISVSDSPDVQVSILDKLYSSASPDEYVDVFIDEDIPIYDRIKIGQKYYKYTCKGMEVSIKYLDAITGKCVWEGKVQDGATIRFGTNHEGYRICIKKEGNNNTWVSIVILENGKWETVNNSV